MVDARIKDKVVSDGKKAVSLVNSEEKLSLVEYVDSQELEKDLKNNVGKAVFNVLTKLSDDEQKLNCNIIALRNALSDWLGDLQAEIRFAGPDGSRQIFGYFEKISVKNKDLESRHDGVKKDIEALRKSLKIDIVTLHGDSQKLSGVMDIVHGLVNNAKSLFNDVDSVKKFIAELDTYVQAFNAQSPELKNYQNVEQKLDDLLEGKGVYVAYTLRQRYDILLRALRTKSMIKLPDGVQFSSEMLKDTQSLRKIKVFMKEYEDEAKLSMSNLTIENPKHNEYMYYNDSLARLRKNFKNHLRPIQFYEILLEHFRTNGLGTHEEVAKNILSGKGEWVSVAFRKKKNVLEISWDPENIAWNGKEYVTNGELRVDASFDIGNKKAGNYYKISEFPSELVHALYGADAGELSKYNAGIYLFLEEGKWWPVGSISNFDLNANDNKWASRGVR